ncbi:hypothetical protein ACJIZ3_014565 [Penstemon smallii]|uniref:Uncharacterized protein n=1 Tax=Penstemon smallii TaxID=265156 RepID=A0ABD3RJY5_9LAMI
MATVAVFTIANRYGDLIRSGWRNVLDYILSLQKIGLLPSRLARDATDDVESSSDRDQVKTLSTNSPASHVPARKSSGIMGRFSLLLSLDAKEPAARPSEEQLAAHQRTLQTIQNCHIDSIFADSKFLQAESLSQLVCDLVAAAKRPHKGNNSLQDEDTSVFCLELLIAITLNNRDRIMLLWENVYDHIASVVQSTVMPSQHPEASEAGFETLSYIMSEGAHLSPANYVLCLDAARQFDESRVGFIDRSVNLST